MDFTEYQARTSETAVYPGQGEFMGLAYAVLGLVGEAGETGEQIKKTWRDDGQILTPERVAKIRKELGDTLWYAARVATEIGADLGDVANENIEKLRARKAANLIHGEGSDR